MFIHQHPYPPFVPESATRLIVGTLPPPRFSIGTLKENDIDFCYGSRDGQLWKILDSIFDLNLKYESSKQAIDQRKQFLSAYGIGIFDIVEQAEREKIDASDLGMQNVVLRDLIGYLKQHPRIKTLLFTGGNSKNGPEYFFRRHIKDHSLNLKLISNEVPRIHQLDLGRHKVKTVSLTAPSGSANRAIGSMALYKMLKAKNPNFTTFDFRVMQYRPFFESSSFIVE